MSTENHGLFLAMAGIVSIHTGETQHLWPQQHPTSFRTYLEFGQIDIS